MQFKDPDKEVAELLKDRERDKNKVMPLKDPDKKGSDQTAAMSLGRSDFLISLRALPRFVEHGGVLRSGALAPAYPVSW
jgi:hypothetical protein